MRVYLFGVRESAKKASRRDRKMDRLPASARRRYGRLMQTNAHRILFVCLGNICRSPAAEGVLRSKAAQRDIDVYVESAGTGDWHAGNPPDARMIRAASRRGYRIDHQRARQVELSDFYTFNYILAMDLTNQGELLAMAPPNRECDIRLFLDFADCAERETPDPYFGGERGFERVLSLIELGADGFLDHLENESG